MDCVDPTCKTRALGSVSGPSAPGIRANAIAITAIHIYLDSFVDLLGGSPLLELCFQPLVESILVVATGSNCRIARSWQGRLLAQSKSLLKGREFHRWRQLLWMCNAGKAACPRLKEHESATSKPKVSCAIFAIRSYPHAGLHLYRAA